MACPFLIFALIAVPAFLVHDPGQNLPIPPGLCIDGHMGFGDGHLSFLHFYARKGRHENPVFPHIY
jgi:hypothetical protein